jgi:hypothetical protein
MGVQAAGPVGSRRRSGNIICTLRTAVPAPTTSTTGEVAMSKAIRAFRKLSPIKQAAIVAVTGWNVALITIAQRDLASRPDSQIRGSKRLWRVACLTNTIGPLSYFRWGRRTG